MIDELTVSEETLACAFEYAVGRKSYIVGTVVRDISENAELLSSETRKTMIKRITKKLDMNELGHANDRQQWLALLEKLEEVESEA